MEEITIVYNPSSTSTSWSASTLTLTIGVDGTAGDFDQRDGDNNPMWTRLERNWYQDAKLAPEFQPSHVTAARLTHTPSGDPMRAGALSFSNSVTIEHNTLGPGVVGHMLHSRAISPVTFAATDRWFAYDQVGSVIAETDADGELAATHHADAWGNRLEAWDTGVWGGQRFGWAHNTKEIDALTDLTYMYQRWYNPETGTFLSRAPYPPMIEHEYGFALGNPVMHTDSTGMIIDLSHPSLEDEEACNRLLEALRDLLSLPGFESIIEELLESEREYVLAMNDRPSSSFYPDPDDRRPDRRIINVSDSDGPSVRVPLAHELGHADEHRQSRHGTNDMRRFRPGHPDWRWFSRTEKNAIGWENYARGHFGYPPRTRYLRWREPSS